MTKALKALLPYLILLILIFGSHALSPTNMAGLGWDIIIYFVSVIVSIGLLANSLTRKENEKKTTKKVVWINLAGTLLVIGSCAIL